MTPAQRKALAGLTFADCVEYFAAKNRMREKTIIEMAWAEHQQDGEVEVDSKSILSEGDDNGTYVMAWVWVSFEDTKFDKAKVAAGTRAPGYLER